MAQDEFPSARSRLLPIPTCRLIRVIEMPLRKNQGHETQPKIALLDVCLPAEERNRQHPQISFEENGIMITRIYEVIKIFKDRAAAEKYARENWIKDAVFEEDISILSNEKISDCHVIRMIDIPLTKKPNAVTEPKIALLNTCLNDKIPQQRPVLEVVRNGKTEFREFDVIKIFADRIEAELYAKENNLDDVNFAR